MVSALPPPPTESSNWLIPGRLVIGEHPSREDAVDLISAGVNTFVCLIGEYSLDQYKSQYYPKDVQAYLSRSGSETGRHVDFLHFPIADFTVTKATFLKSLVAELKKRLVTDANTVMYIHCRGGHG